VIDAVVTHHTDASRSGVARFNELLAAHLGVPVLSLSNHRVKGLSHPLLSFKVSELDSGEAADLEGLLAAAPWSWSAFLHEYADLELERRVVEHAETVFCGNHAIAERVQPLAANVETVWTPGLIAEDRLFVDTDISVFSFGMAHKMRRDMLARLRDLLEGSGQTWALYVSAANHETASVRDVQLVFEELREVFPDHLYFLGNLSDLAVLNYLKRTAFFAAFFPAGVRANNTSVAAAMEHGAVVITNLDEHSPPEFVHMENVLDIDRCKELPTDPAVLGRLARNAEETAAGRGWDDLVARIRA
jgi:hypothetical protein